MVDEALDLSPTLLHLPEGTRARIVQIDGGRNLARRLLSLGLRIGSEIHIVQQRKKGVVIANNDNRVALGYGVADKLFMLPLDQT
ncbi:MAG: ferrous iron transport protein A [Gammaproteobacteria bacterium]|nr:ferrous iron transport protein A [Gammaproteobacteria bacterium]